MYKAYKIRAPYFEIGPKCFMWGKRMLKLAQAVDKIAEKYDLDVIVTPQYADIRLIAENTKHIHVYAQHMDTLRPGRGLGSVLPESIKAAGAVGVGAVPSVSDAAGKLVRPDKRYVPSGADYEDAYLRFAALDEKMNQVKIDISIKKQSFQQKMQKESLQETRQFVNRTCLFFPQRI